MCVWYLWDRETIFAVRYTPLSRDNPSRTAHFLPNLSLRPISPPLFPTTTKLPTSAIPTLVTAASVTPGTFGRNFPSCSNLIVLKYLRQDPCQHASTFCRKKKCIAEFDQPCQ